MKATELLPWLLLHQTNQDVPGWPLQEVEIDFTQSWLEELDKQTHTRLAGRLMHVKGLYKPMVERPGHLVFPKGCLDWYKDGHLKWRKRSEWFVKFISDLLFIQNMTGRAELVVTIPQFFMKQEACPVIRLWAQRHGYKVSDWINTQADAMIARYPTAESTLTNKRRACRAWLLRYHVLTGSWPAERFQELRRI